MPDVLIRGLDKSTLQRLKARAKRHGRSVQSEAKTILRHAAGLTFPEAQALAAQWHRKLAGRKFPDSADLLREDRAR